MVNIGVALAGLGPTRGAGRTVECIQVHLGTELRERGAEGTARCHAQASSIALAAPFVLRRSRHCRRRSGTAGAESSVTERLWALLTLLARSILRLTAVSFGGQTRVGGIFSCTWPSFAQITDGHEIT